MLWRPLKVVVQTERWALCLFGLLISTGILFAGGSDQDGNQAAGEASFDVCRAAWIESHQKQPSARASGSYAIRRGGQDSVAGDVEIEQSDSRFRVDIKFSTNKERPNLVSRCIIGEPGSIFLRDTARPGPNGTVPRPEGYLHKLGKPEIMPPIAQYPFHPTHLITMINLATMDRTFVKSSRVTDEGDIELRYAKPPAYAKIICAKQYGFNVRSCEASRGSLDGPVLQAERFVWAKTGDGRWYIKEVASEFRPWDNGKPGPASVARLTLSRLDPMPIDPARFTIDEAGLAPGSKIQVHEDATKAQSFTYNPGADTTKDAGLAESVAALPPIPDPGRPRGRPWWVYVLYGTGAVLVAGGITLWWRRKRQVT